VIGPFRQQAEHLLAGQCQPTCVRGVVHRRVERLRGSRCDADRVNVAAVLGTPQGDAGTEQDCCSLRVVSRDGDKQKVFLRVRRTKWVTAVYDTEYDVEYRSQRPSVALYLDRQRQRDRRRRCGTRAG